MFELTRTFNDIRSFLDIMQATTAPAMIISALAFLLSIMAARYARAIDRTRELIDQLEAGGSSLSAKKRASLHYQLRVIFKRSLRLQWMMTTASLCIFFVVLTIGAIFVGLLYGFHLEAAASAMFLLALLLLIISMAMFVKDLLISLHGIKIEIQEVEKEIVR
jgi:hypothetical protein